mmetsp:Transcript_19631/g.29261  ORF Transcript_19631/g.29261 Transcript_19631/m.29261 type:complete len:81 (+) Transcript_19631:742-984(+)
MLSTSAMPQAAKYEYAFLPSASGASLSALMVKISPPPHRFVIIINIRKIVTTPPKFTCNISIPLQQYYGKNARASEKAVL